MKSKRFLCQLLVLLMVFSLTPSETRAETTVYFTAVNDQNEQIRRLGKNILGCIVFE